MIEFFKQDDMLILSYTPERGQPGWVNNELKSKGSVSFRRTFTFQKEDLCQTSQMENILEEDEIEEETCQFFLAYLEGDYYKVKKDVIITSHDIYIHKDVNLKISYFVADPNISILGTIEALSEEDIYIGGELDNAIPDNAYQQLIKTFPNAYERKKYAHARITSLLRNYLETAVDGEKNYFRYMSNKTGTTGNNLKKMFKDLELFKHQTILEKIDKMLNTEDGYTEKQWQEEILQIILLLYPKYIFVFREVMINDLSVGERYLDYMLVDASGHVDIIEIKRPFDKCIVTEKKYRNNYIPLRDLSGTIMQLEKYIFFLNRWGERGEGILTSKYGRALPEGFKIKITNPGGIIIMGRENNLTLEQKLDFEVVKRKYKNVIDIITYDNLISRLKVTIDQITKT